MSIKKRFQIILYLEPENLTKFLFILIAIKFASSKSKILVIRKKCLQKIYVYIYIYIYIYREREREKGFNVQIEV